MSELELLRDIAADPAPPSPHLRERARAMLVARIEAAERRSRRPWLLSLSGAVATVGVAAAVFFTLGGGGSHSASAATALLHKAAAAALAQPGLGALDDGQYIYTKSVDAYLSTTVPNGVESSFSALVPHTREIWLGRDGTGWLHETTGTATFLSARDRQRWIAAGGPDLGSGGVTDMALGNEDGPTPPMQSLDLPSDPDALYNYLEKQARGYGSGLYEEMFTLIGDNLRENYTTPAQRSALFEVAARLPGVELIGEVTDPVGRTGVGVTMNSRANHERNTLIFDPVDYELLGEEQTVLAGNFADYPAVTVVGYGAYLEQAVVGALKERP